MKGERDGRMKGEGGGKSVRMVVDFVLGSREM